MSTRHHDKHPPGSRAEAQTNRILDAAEQCFIEYGFHAASMASISKIAKMSPGLIYRYFENKNAIIIAIIERQLKERREDIEKMQADLDLAGRILELFESWTKVDPDTMNPLLFLEMSAEAARVPEIGQAVANSDRLSRESIKDWLRKRAASHGVHPSDEALNIRALALHCFAEGLVVRAVREKDHDLKQAAACIKLFVDGLLDWETDGK